MSRLLTRRTVAQPRPFASKKELAAYVNILIDKVQNGDTQARNDLSKVLITFLSKISTKLAITNQELLSSINWVVTKILNNIGILDKQKNVLSYISNSVKNFCIDEYRKVQVRKRREDTFKSIGAGKTTTMTHTLSFMLEDITKSSEELAILNKIVIDKKPILEISKELNIPRKEIDLLLERIKLELT